MIQGYEGGWAGDKRQTSGLSESALAPLREQTEQLAEDERGAVLDGRWRAVQLEEDENAPEMLRDIKKTGEKRTGEKQIFDRRQKVQQQIAEVSNQEPDKRRAFPTGFSGVMTFIGAVAGGMLQGLQGGSNPVLDALMHRLDEDVKQRHNAERTTEGPHAPVGQR